MNNTASMLMAQIRAALGEPAAPAEVAQEGSGSLPSVFAVSDLAQASIGAAGAALASFMAMKDGRTPDVTVDRDLCSAWFALSIRPQGWELPPAWDAVAGDYAASDGWIRLHTNAPHHRAAALGVLGVPEDRNAVTWAVAQWSAEELETAVVVAGGAAAAMRSLEAWERHRQGQAVGSEQLIEVERTPGTSRAVPRRGAREDRPLDGLRVLDLTRVLAGPVATRLLAGWGAEVLRIDPPDWDEPAVVPEVTLGKRCARLDLRTPGGAGRFLELLGSADVLVHGFRSDALEGLGLGADVRAEHRPGLIDVSLDAYGWTGPWQTRRGFDSLVQMSTGIADAGRAATGTQHPVPLPVQALDHATGYLLAGAAITGLTQRLVDGGGSRWRASLARTAALLVGAGQTPEVAGTGIEPASPRPDDPPERTVWGNALRLPPPLRVQGAPLRWSLPARPLGSDDPRWQE